MLTFKSELETEESGRWNMATHTWCDDDDDDGDGDPIIIFINITIIEKCTLLGYYTASSGNSLLTFRDNLSVPKRRQGITATCCITVHRSAVLIYFMAEAWKSHTIIIAPVVMDQQMVCSVPNCNSLDWIFKKKILNILLKCSAYLMYEFFKLLQWCSSGLRSSRILWCLNRWLLCDTLGYLGGPIFNNLLSSEVTGLLMMKLPSCPKLSGTNHPMVQCNISEICKPHFVQVQNICRNIFWSTQETVLSLQNVHDQ